MYGSQAKSLFLLIYKSLRNATWVNQKILTYKWTAFYYNIAQYDETYHNAQVVKRSTQ